MKIIPVANHLLYNLNHQKNRSVPIRLHIVMHNMQSLDKSACSFNVIPLNTRHVTQNYWAKDGVKYNTILQYVFVSYIAYLNITLLRMLTPRNLPKEMSM